MQINPNAIAHTGIGTSASISARDAKAASSVAEEVPAVVPGEALFRAATPFMAVVFASGARRNFHNHYFKTKVEEEIKHLRSIVESGGPISEVKAEVKK